MNWLKNIIHPLHHCEDATMFFLTLLGVKVSRSALQKDLVEHPNYPSLLSVSEVIRSYGIYNTSLKLSREDWPSQLATPFLAHVKSNRLKHGIFSVVLSFSDEQIEMYSPASRKVEVVNNDDFRNYYSGTILLAEVGEHAGESDYEESLKAEKKSIIFYAIAIFFLPFITILSCLIYLVNSKPSLHVAITPVLLAFLSLAGAIVGSLLLWHDIDEYNPVVKQICQAGKTVNCSAILNSKAAKIFGFSWSSIGLSYFFGTLFVLLSGGLYSLPTLTLLCCLNVLTFPYIVFSLLYQWRVAKQWCIMCLVVQGILALQFTAAVSGSILSKSNFLSIGIPTYCLVIFAFVFSFIVVNVIITIIKKSKENRIKGIELQRLKRNPKIFEALLTRQRAVEHTTTGLGVNLGNPNGKYKIIKVCNPYCGPCAKAHPLLEQMLESNSEISLQVIFTATNSNSDHKRPPALHLLAIDAMKDRHLTRRAFSSWYNSPEKNYRNFASLYPIEGDMEAYSESISAMEKWCELANITYTPTIFVNGYQLPEIYSLKDLNSILKADAFN